MGHVIQTERKLSGKKQIRSFLSEGKQTSSLAPIWLRHVRLETPLRFPTVANFSDG